MNQSIIQSIAPVSATAAVTTPILSSIFKKQSMMCYYKESNILYIINWLKYSIHQKIHIINWSQLNYEKEWW